MMFGYKYNKGDDTFTTPIIIRVTTLYTYHIKLSIQVVSIVVYNSKTRKTIIFHN